MLELGILLVLLPLTLLAIELGAWLADRVLDWHASDVYEDQRREFENRAKRLAEWEAVKGRY